MKVGAAFGDHIKTGSAYKRHYDSDLPNPIRSFLFPILLFILPCILIFKLINLQLINGSYYRSLSDSNRTKTIVLYPQRGIIFDHSGTPLVYNNPGYKKTTNSGNTSVTREEAIELMTKDANQLLIESNRFYPLKEATAHVLGFVGKISKEELSQTEYSNYTQADIVGKSGIEQYYDNVLQGTKGKELVEVDALGRKIRTLGQTDPIAGRDIKLTLDAKLQQVVYKILPDDQKSAVVVSTPFGEILAMVSKPSFDPNIFTLDKTYKTTDSNYKNVTDILTDSANQPLLNRSISGTYPPGSTFKIVTAAAGLNQNIIDQNFTVDDSGILRVGTFSFANWYYLDYGKTDGIVNVVKAIARSNDIFFYKLAEKINVDNLSKTAMQFGIGSPLGIDLPGEAKGILPTRQWKLQTIKEPWYLGDTYHYGIGQGYLLTTPLQVNAWTQVIANGGTLYIPHVLINSKFEIRNSKFLSENTISLIREGMVGACSPGGVAYPLFNFKIQNSKTKIDGKNFLAVKEGSSEAELKDYLQISIACKTGTAQYGEQDSKPHAWITLFAPAYNPQIVVTVLVESAGQGSDIAAPIAKKILEAWFGNNK
jgi:penicillin-binding protein 2